MACVIGRLQTNQLFLRNFLRWLRALRLSFAHRRVSQLKRKRRHQATFIAQSKFGRNRRQSCQSTPYEKTERAKKVRQTESVINFQLITFSESRVVMCDGARERKQKTKTFQFCPSSRCFCHFTTFEMKCFCGFLVPVRPCRALQNGKF